MTGIICKLPNGNYLIWSPTTASPITYGVALPALETYLCREEGERYMREEHPRRMRDVEMHGTSQRARRPTSFEKLILGNRAGADGEELTLEQIMEEFGQLPAGYVEDEVALPNPNRCARCIGEKPDDGLADAGVCGCCGEAADVWDPALVSLYAGIGLTTDEVWGRLPRLRSSRMPAAPVLTARGEAEIWRKIGEIVPSLLKGRA